MYLEQLDTDFRLSHYYKIKPAHGGVQTFVPQVFQQQKYNRLHRSLRNSQSYKEITLKSRKFGETTGDCIWIEDHVAHNPYTKAVTMAHTSDKSGEIFRDIVKFSWKRVPRALKPKETYNTKSVIDLSDEMGSEYSVTNDVKSITPKILHVTEAAYFMKDEDIQEAMNAVPEGGITLLESTAHGVGNLFEVLFNEAWTARLNGEPHPFFAVFLAWWMDPKNRVASIENRKMRYPHEASQKALKVLEEYGVMLTQEQLFWWDEKKQINLGFMDQFYPTTPEEAFLQSGRPVFDLNNLRLMQAKYGAQPTTVMNDFVIFEEPDPDDYYGIGVDTAEGLVHGDNASITVMSRNTGREVAQCTGAFSPHELARKLGWVCSEYDQSDDRDHHLAVIERNNHGHTVIAYAKEDPDIHLYRREVKDKITEETSMVIGWDTNEKSKGIAINTLSRDLENRNCIPRSFDTYGECRSYVHGERGKMGARKGKKDDRVISLALANAACQEIIITELLTSEQLGFY